MVIDNCQKSIYWPISRDHIADSSLDLIGVTRFLKYAAVQLLIFDCAHIRLKQDRVVRKPVDANPWLNINQVINFSCTQMFFTAFFCFVYFDIIQTQNRRPNSIQKTSLQSQKETSNTDPALLLGLAIYHIRPSISVDISYDR